MTKHGPLDLLAVFRSLRDLPQTTYVVSPERTLVRFNPAWAQFARANHGEHVLTQWPRHSSLLAAIPEVLRAFYVTHFAAACRTGERWEHDYECSSDQVYRRFRMTAYPFGDFLVVSHALLVERAHDRQASAAGDGYLHDGVVVMCSHCRLVRRAPPATAWDWVPELVAAMPENVSHGLCPPCLEYYYPEPQSV